MSQTVLVRYGAIPEIARFRAEIAEPLERGQRVVVRSPRGVEIGTVLESLSRAEVPGFRVPGPGKDSVAGSSTLDPQPSVRDPGPSTPNALTVLRRATADDELRWDRLRSDCERDYDQWHRRIKEWELNLELIDLEWTLDREKLVLYVLNDRGPDCTKLALQAAAAGLGTIEVQPVDADGLVSLNTSGGCGSGGCGCGS